MNKIKEIKNNLIFNLKKRLDKYVDKKILKPKRDAKKKKYKPACLKKAKPFTLNTDKFKNWLLMHGCEILPPEENEVFRFKGKGAAIGSVFNINGNWNSYADYAIICFRNNKKWNGAPKSTPRVIKKNDIPSIRQRDGYNCFYCSLPLATDVTIEHLIPLTAGGTNRLSNKVLCHSVCNTSVGCLPVNQKIEIAIAKRSNPNKKLSKKFVNKIVSQKSY